MHHQAVDRSTNRNRQDLPPYPTAADQHQYNWYKLAPLPPAILSPINKKTHLNLRKNLIHKILRKSMYYFNILQSLRPSLKMFNNNTHLINIG